jgi:hypothetical protein
LISSLNPLKGITAPGYLCKWLVEKPGIFQHTVKGCYDRLVENIELRLGLFIGYWKKSLPKCQH